MVTLEEACNIILDELQDYTIEKCDDGGTCYIFGLKKEGDEPERGLRGPYCVDKTTGKIDRSMDVTTYLDYILEHDNTEIDLDSLFKGNRSSKRAS